MVRFVERKKLITEHAGDVLPGDPNAQWYSMPSPSRLPFFLERFPDTNHAHIMHSALFVHPTVELSSRDMTSLTADLGLNLTRATPIGNLSSLIPRRE
ncbi:hypothetical protein M8J76_012933 [Diaphorina citri]|nr:hypothetical protein M8J76_012933 [Diaphorina citri]